MSRLCWVLGACSSNVERARISVSDRVDDVAIARADAYESVGMRCARFARVQMAGGYVGPPPMARDGNSHVPKVALSARQKGRVDQPTFPEMKKSDRVK